MRVPPWALWGFVTLLVCSFLALLFAWLAASEPRWFRAKLVAPVIVVLAVVGGVAGHAANAGHPAATSDEAAPAAQALSSPAPVPPVPSPPARPPAATSDPADGVDRLVITIKLDCVASGPASCSGADSTPTAGEAYHAIVQAGAGQWIYSDQCLSYHRVVDLDTGTVVINNSSWCNVGEPLLGHRLAVGHYQIREAAVLGSLRSAATLDFYVQS